jgi:large subunit ribosomal protein L15
MNLSSLPKLIQRSSKRVGRGIGSGKGGHTSSRGQKGQKSRETVALGFEGTKMKKSFMKKLPLLRGKGKLKPWGSRPVEVNLGNLGEWPEKMPVNAQNLLKQNVIHKLPKWGVKILGKGKIKSTMTVEVPVSKGAEKKITKAGGKIIPYE